MTNPLAKKFKEIIARKVREQANRLKAEKLAKSREQSRSEKFKALIRKQLVQAEMTLEEILTEAPEIGAYIEVRAGRPLYIFNANGLEKVKSRRLKVTGKSKDLLGLGIQGETVELLTGDRLLGRAIWTSKENGSKLCLVLDSQGRLSVAIHEHRQPYGCTFCETDNFDQGKMFSVLSKFETPETAMEMLVEQFGVK